MNAQWKPQQTDKTPIVKTSILMQEALDEIIKNQPKVYVTSSKTNACQAVHNTDQYKHIIDNHPKV